MSTTEIKERLGSRILRAFRCRLKRARLRGTTVFAVTGSCGKTSTTYLLSRILGTQGSCVTGIEAGSYLGIYRTLRDMPCDHEFYVQETSGHLPGQLARVLPLVRPHVGIVTSVGLDHYHAFRSRDAVAAEKSTMVRWLPRSGTAVLNADDPHVLAMAGQARARVLSYGRSELADVRATDVRAAWPELLSFVVHYRGESVKIETRLFSDILLTAILAAISGALAVGVPLQSCAAALQGVQSYPGRMSVQRVSPGRWMIHDAAKAPHWTMPLVVEQLARAKAPRKTMVIGSMSDTSGADSGKYRSIGRDALEVADRVVFVGKKASHIPKMMKPEYEGRLFAFESIEDAARFLGQDVIEDELVFIKSGRLEHLERLIHAQEHRLKCWIQSCHKKCECAQCGESGLAG